MTTPQGKVFYIVRYQGRDMSYWTTAEKAEKALAHYREQGLVDPDIPAEVIAGTLNSDGFHPHPRS